MNKKLIVGISQGDSNGIGYEVIIKALSDERILSQFTPVVYGSPKIWNFYLKTIPEIEKLDVNVIPSAKNAQSGVINLVNCLADNVFAEPGAPTPEGAQAAIKALSKAVEEIKAGYLDVIVTAPINKKAISGQGFKFPGHTEFFQDAFKVNDVTMLMISDRLTLGVATGHIPLKDVPAAITKEKILSKLRVMKQSLARDFRIDNPKIAVLSLNPHSGDGGLLGTEEQDIIIPAIKDAQEEGINAFGPFSPDGYFGLGTYEKFDATLAMYHDQGLSPFKAIVFADGVNYTAGLPIVRTSPDHGTAYELAGRDLADCSSMRSAIYAAIDIYNNKAAYDYLLEGKMEERTIEEERPERPGRPQIV